MAISDHLLCYAGGVSLKYPGITFSGKHEKYFELYGDQVYFELMITGSGTLTIPSGSIVCDIWGIGGGGGTNGYAGGGSGYTAMLEGAALSGNITVTIGDGNTNMADGDATTVSGTAFVAAGGKASVSVRGGDGGSGGGGANGYGGANGGNGTGTDAGMGDGKAMAKFYDPAKANYADTIAKNGSGGSGYGGLIAYTASGSIISGSAGYGAGASRGIEYTSGGYPATHFLAGLPGICFIRIKMG